MSSNESDGGVTAKGVVCVCVSMCVVGIFFNFFLHVSISLRKCVQCRPPLRNASFIDCQFARSPLFIYLFFGLK